MKKVMLLGFTPDWRNDYFCIENSLFSQFNSAHVVTVYPSKADILVFRLPFDDEYISNFLGEVFLDGKEVYFLYHPALKDQVSIPKKFADARVLTSITNYFPEIMEQLVSDAN